MAPLSYTGLILVQLAIKQAETPVVVPVHLEKTWLRKWDQMCQNQSE